MDLSTATLSDQSFAALPSEGLTDNSYPHDDPTFEKVVEFCLRLQPDEAARLCDSDLCVTPLIERIIIDGQEHRLSLDSRGRWGAHNVRVSTVAQRSAFAQMSRGGNPGITSSVNSGVAKANQQRARGAHKGKAQYEGYSEEEQVRRGIRYFVAQGQAFKLYSDAGVTGEYPNNDGEMVKKLLRKKAARYKAIFEATLLDANSLARRTPDQVAALRAYLDYRLHNITERDISAEGLVGRESNAKITPDRVANRSHAAPIEKRAVVAMHRQGFSQLWNDAEQGLVHTVTTTERSRLCRDADLESAFCQVLDARDVEVVGLVEDMSMLRGRRPIQKGMNYLVASMHEERLEEIQGSSFRGIVQALESGKPHGMLPWFLARDRDGFAILKPGAGELVQRIVDLYLSGMGAHRMETKFRDAGETFEGRAITKPLIMAALDPDVISGQFYEFGLFWPVLPTIVSDPDVIAELRQQRTARRDEMALLLQQRSWASHVLTGLLSCACGGRMKYNAYSCSSKSKQFCYHCTSSGRVKAEHGLVRADEVETFFGDVFRDHPELMSGQFARTLGSAHSTVADAAAQRSIIEQRLAEAEEAFKAKEAEALNDARAKALAIPMPEHSPYFAATAASIAASLLEQPQRELDDLRARLAHMRVESNRRKRSAQFADSIKALADWDHLEPQAKNRLLRSVIESITVYPQTGENKLVVKLLSIDDPLPPIRMRRVNVVRSRFPTVAEWIADTFRKPGEDVNDPYWMLTMENTYGFYVWLNRQHGDSDRDVAALLEYVGRANKQRFFGMSVRRERMLQKLHEKGMPPTMLEVVGRLFTRYQEEERARILAGLPMELRRPRVYFERHRERRRQKANAANEVPSVNEQAQHLVS
jgi:hypothetical protein